MGSHELKTKALEQLKGRWGVAIAVSLVASLLMNLIKFNKRIPLEIIPTLSISLSLLNLILGGVLSAGKAKFFLTLKVNKESALFSDLFSQFNNFLKATGLYLLISLFTFLGILLLIIPGIIVIYMYSQSFYILAENPEKSVTECMYESRQLMKGHKFDLFCVQISFIGWIILGVISFGIGLLWVSPYMDATFANFYSSLKEEIGTNL